MIELEKFVFGCCVCYSMTGVVTLISRPSEVTHLFTDNDICATVTVPYGIHTSLKFVRNGRMNLYLTTLNYEKIVFSTTFLIVIFC